jgi:transposase
VKLTMSTAPYSEAFKRKMVAKLVGPGAKSATELSTEVGIPQSTLSRWILRAGTVGPALTKKIAPEITDRPAVERRKERTASEKLMLLMESMSLPDDELGAFLRREGLHEAELREWRESAHEALEGRAAAAGRKKQEVKRVRELEKELRRKDKALAETAALLVLQKKVQAIWGVADDDTNEENER